MRITLVIFLSSFAATRAFSRENVTTTIRKDVEARVEALLATMTLEEKLGQLYQGVGELAGGYTQENLDMARAGSLGSTLFIRGAHNVNALQRAALESRLKIPIIFSYDVIHGYRTLFPIPLGETASFDLEAAELSAAIAAEEARAAGLHWTFAPMVDISRDPRWGRVMEGAGEDVYLGTKMAEARIRGFQGSDYSDPKKMVACAKHFVGYGAGEAGREYNTVDMSERRMRETYLPPFKASVDAGVGSLMTSFNDLNGMPATANKMLLRKILRDEWQFDGVVISDYNAVAELVNHGLAADYKEAAMWGLNGGTDMEMYSRTYLMHAKTLIEQKNVTQQTVDNAVRNVLRIKYRLGLFENPFVNESLEAVTYLRPDFLQAAREIAAKSFVLLKNEQDVLPINQAGLKEIAVIGGLADDKPNTMDWWNGDARGNDSITILQGIKDRLKNSSTTITFAKGCESICSSKDQFAEAVSAATNASVVVVVVGEVRDASGEGGSMTNIDLPGFQLELIKAIHALGKPYVVVVKNGRPMTLDWVSIHSLAILVTWHAGTMVGPAVADVLFGDVNPSGKLPMTFPRNTGQIPIHYDEKSTGRPYRAEERTTSKYIDCPNTPLYPFGFGLSYTTFEYRNLQLHPENKVIQVGDTITVSVEVKNNGTRDGTEVVQLYIRDVTASVTKPVRQLRGFQRIFLKKDETKAVTFVLGPEDMGLLDENWKWIVEPGFFDVFVGTNSYADLTARFTVVPKPAASSTAGRNGAVLVLFAMLLVFLIRFK